MLLMLESVWKSWTPWSPCTVTCMAEGGKPGSRSRSRECVEGQNGGKECIASESEEKMDCAGDGQSFISCPVDHFISIWSEWSDCSTKCGPGKSLRYRHCQDGRLGGTKCPKIDLDEEKVCETKPCPE